LAGWTDKAGIAGRDEVGTAGQKYDETDENTLGSVLAHNYRSDNSWPVSRRKCWAGV